MRCTAACSDDSAESSRELELRTALADGIQASQCLEDDTDSRPRSCLSIDEQGLPIAFGTGSMQDGAGYLIDKGCQELIISSVRPALCHFGLSARNHAEIMGRIGDSPRLEFVVRLIRGEVET